MPELADDVRPMMRTRARLKSNEARLNATEELQQLRPPQGSPDDDAAVFGDAMNLKDRLGQVQADRGNLLHGTVPFCFVTMDITTIGTFDAASKGRSKPSLCVIHRLLATMSLWAGMQKKSKWSPGPGVKILGVTLTVDDGWVERIA